MASSEPVEVAVEILDSFSDELNELRARLEEIDGKTLNVELEISEDEIKKVKAQLKELEGTLQSALDIDVEDHIQAKAIKKELSRDMHSTLHIDTKGEHLRNLSGGTEFGPPGGDDGGYNVGNRKSVMDWDYDGSTSRSIKRGIDFDVDRPANLFPDMGGGGRGSSRKVGTITNPAKALGPAIKRLIPSMHTWLNLLAVAVPALITLAGAALGAASALVALGGAGLAMGGLGILGFGDDAGSAMQNFKKELKKTGKEIVQILQPVGDAFQPFVQGILDRAPSMVQNLVDPLQRLSEVGFDTFWIEALEGASSWVGNLIDAMANLAPQIQEIGWAMGKIFGDILIGLLEWSVKELYNNWDAFMRLGQIVGDLILVLYGLSKSVTFALSVFKPVFDAAAAITNLFSNRLIGALLAATAAMVAMSYVLGTITTIFYTLKGYALANLFYNAALGAGALNGALGITSGILDVLLAKLAAMNTLTGGILAITGILVGGLALSSLSSGGSGPGGPGGSGARGYTPPAGRASGGGGGTTINIHGDVRNKEYQKLKDQFPGMYNSASETDDKTSR